MGKNCGNDLVLYLQVAHNDKDGVWCHGGKGQKGVPVLGQRARRVSEWGVSAFNWG